MSNFLILDGYPEAERKKFDDIGMTRAGELYKQMLFRYTTEVEHKIVYTSDSEEALDEDFLQSFDAILWPGCSLTVYENDWRAKKMLSIAEAGFELGLPQFGSCWAAQLAVHIVGGKVSPHEKGREIGISRRIKATETGREHLMYDGKPAVFEAFTSHDDFIEYIPPQYCPALSSNDWCDVQAVCIKYKNGEFWAPQYHPEYNFKEMAKLLLARKEKLIRQRHFDTDEQVMEVHDDFIALEQSPTKHLMWKYGVGEAITKRKMRELEFFNWLKKFFPNSLK